MSLQPFGACWGPLDSFGALWDPLGPFGSHWHPLRPFDALWVPLEAFGSLWGPLGSIGALWGPLEPFAPKGSQWDKRCAGCRLQTAEITVRSVRRKAEFSIIKHHNVQWTVSQIVGSVEQLCVSDVGTLHN